MTTERIKEAFRESIEAKEALTDDDYGLILEMAYTMVEATSQGNKIIWMGNGGSAADAQHLAAELVSKFYMEREGMPSLALNCNTSVLTAIGNDYGFEHVFERQIEALARPGDVVVGISTSGNSPNVLLAIDLARNMGCLTLGMTGRSGGKLADVVDLCLKVPSDDTPRIQEVHITAGHIICEIVESVVFG
ncbi:MAG: D-sedoheptulose 7-phosphate isomerase [Thermoplasmata archaeon]|nr:D-sedoheptulose 7-phosphate isomerase [Thermoplasmata archaeon]MCK5413864.1 D-sedoheptulose 7-phosphate isomerase [Thermoplasmata archaeon]